MPFKTTNITEGSEVLPVPKNGSGNTEERLTSIKKQRKSTAKKPTKAKKEKALSDQLCDALEARNFDLIDEFITLYRLGEISDTEKLKAVKELFQYKYPKKKAVELEGSVDVKQISIVTEITYSDEEIS